MCSAERLVSRKDVRNRSRQSKIKMGSGFRRNDGVEVGDGLVGSYSTANPSTFCHPRGNNPPRVARAPR